MRKNSIKNTRINAEVQKELSSILRMEIKDPRIAAMTSVTGAQVAPDLKTCKVYISVLGDDRAKEDTLRGLRSAEGFIRRLFGQESEPPQYAGAFLCAGSVHRVRCSHVETHR